MPFSNEFKTHYSRLNPAQKKAVDTIEGPVMVVAGPGTGKTQILTLRIANILDKTDTPPEAILALTFTEAGVIAMRRRLAEIVGPGAYRATISTFHSFCNNIIQEYPEEFPHIIGSANITDVDQIQIMQDIIDRADIKELRPFGDRFYYLKSALHAIEDIKQEGKSPTEFAKIITEEKKDFEAISDLYYESGAHKGKMKGKYQDLSKQIIKNQELAILYRDYQMSLHSSKLYDYSDMLIEVLYQLRKNKELLLMLQERYQYILIDEHQDTNSAQNGIIELLASFYERPNLFVVGDEKQAIYRFQGASLENFLYFKHLYKDAQLIYLEQNYRSTQAILDSAHGLAPKSIPLKSQGKETEKIISLYAFSRFEVESFFLAEHISKRLEGGVPGQEIAVLYRENADAMAIAPMLERFGIPFTIESSKNILDDEDIRKLLLIFHAVKNFGSAQELFEVLHVDFFDISPLDAYKLSSFSYSQRANPYDLISSANSLREAGVESVQPFLDLSQNLSRWKRTAKNVGAARAFEDIIRESGFLANILKKSDAIEKIAKIHILFDQIKALMLNHKNYTLEEFLDYVNLLQTHQILLKNTAERGIPGRVRLMTAHSSKGLEFDYVYLVHAYDGHWGSRRRIQHFRLPRKIFSLLQKTQETLDGDDMQDERNLFYVALTRARKEFIISYSKARQDGRELLPTQFILEIKPELIEQADTVPYEKEFSSRRDLEFAPRQAVEPPISSRQFLNELFKRQGFSVTALNNYLECPWQYFYRNLIRIPEAPNKHLMYGNAIDKALKEYFDRFGRNDNPGVGFLISRFKDAVSHQPFQTQELNEALKKGEASLRGYLSAYQSTFCRRIINQYKVDGIEIKEGVTLNGKMDKIEILDDSGHVNVIDYKTGQPKSRTEIEGIATSAGRQTNGNYKRQLVFYNLLLNKEGKYRMASGQIDFVDPDKKGKWHREIFVISKEEISKLEKLITQTVDEILGLSFWTNTCEKSDCRYCQLRKMMVH